MTYDECVDTDRLLLTCRAQAPPNITLGQHYLSARWPTISSVFRQPTTIIIITTNEAIPIFATSLVSQYRGSWVRSLQEKLLLSYIIRTDHAAKQNTQDNWQPLSWDFDFCTYICMVDAFFSFFIRGEQQMIWYSNSWGRILLEFVFVFGWFSHIELYSYSYLLGIFLK